MMRGWFREQLVPVAEPGSDETKIIVEGRPSLLAALDVPFKAIGTVALLILPFIITAALIRGEPVTSLRDLPTLELMQLAPAFLLAFAPAIRLAFTRYRIDEEGVQVHSQVLSRTESRVAWDKVTAIRHRITLVDRVLGLQRIDIIAYGERGTTLHLVGMRNVRLLRDLAAQRMREHTTAGHLVSND
jgi:uncharacterized membrane protein YdbT with pleckstrin-like domain